MGVQSQGLLLFKSKEIMFDEMVYLLEQIHAERKRADPPLTLRVRPKVTIDASLIAFKYLSTSIHPSNSVFLISAALAKRNVDVLIVCDPPTRHHSKRAHHQRVGKRETTKLKLMLCRIELSRRGNDADRMKKITTEIQKLEKADSQTCLPDDFLPQLQKLHGAYKSLGKGEITIETAPFQADPSIADVAIRGGCDAIISGDSDFAMYVGPGGPDMLGDIMIRDIKINQRLSTIKSGILVTGQQNVASKIGEILAHRESTAVFPTNPKFPLFDRVNNPTVRALIGIALGCDALPGGVPGVGTSSLYNLLDTCHWDDISGVHVELATKLANQKKAVVTDPQALLCLANSLIYERTSSGVGYMFGAPSTIELYNKSFAAPETQVIDGPAMSLCKGCNGMQHAFLDAEGVSSCVTCRASLCRFCTWEETIDECNTTVCLECKRHSIAGDADQKSEREMRDFLKERAVNLPVAASYAEVLDLFRQYDGNEHGIFSEDISNVMYPVLPALVLNQALDSITNPINRIMTASLNHIGFIIRSNEVKPSMIAGLVHILASLTDIQPRSKGEKLSASHSISKNLVNMAKNARVHTSQRLLERSVRHATDRASPDIHLGQITLGQWNGLGGSSVETCIIIENKVRASMKNVEYRAKAAISHQHFLASECNCRAGCSNEISPNVSPADIGSGKIISSHGMTLAVSLSLALYRGLAAHTLSEIRIRLLREDFESSLDAQTKSAFREDISRLMKATGQAVSAVHDQRTMLDNLEIFAVGTDLPKKAPSPPRSHDLGLLRHKCSYQRSTKMAEDIVLMKEESTETLSDSNISMNLAATMEPTIAEEYLSGQLAIDALSLVFDRQEFQPLLLKATNEDDNEEDDDNDNYYDNDDDDDVEDDNDDCDDTNADNIHNLPVALELLRERAQPHLVKLDYNERSKATEIVAEQWETALLHWTNARGLHVRVFEDRTQPAVTSKKRKADILDANSNDKQFAHNYCCVRGCGGNGITEQLKRIADYPPELPDDASRNKRITYARKLFERRERAERAGVGRFCIETNLRACTKHWEEVSGKSTICNLEQKDGSMKDEHVPIPTFWAPRRIGENSFVSPPTISSKGNGNDRATLRHVMEITNNKYALAQQQILEMQEVSAGTQSLMNINPSILAIAGLDVHTAADKINLNTTTSTHKPTEEINNSRREPTYKLQSLVPKFVKRRTGFRDLKLLLSYVAAICGGDLIKMTRTSSTLTWLEEWFATLELCWGRNILRFPEYATMYRIREQSLRIVIQQKVQLIKKTRGRWPMYASFAEDAKLRDRKWDLHFNGHRVVMHDSTNIPLATPSSAAMQRALYNSYYGMCCAKAGVAVQLCGYIYGLPLNTGHSDDTRFIEDTNILKLQQQFAERDSSSNKPFLNIFDKGYQCTLSALSHGQSCLQPAFAESEKQFKDNAVLHSGAVAVVRSGNERAVKRCKMSWFLKRGAVDQMWNIDLVCDIWEAWTFQVNFMYKKFL